MKKRKLFFAVTALACVLSLSACGSKNKTNENADPLTGEDMSESNENTENESGQNTTNNDLTNHDEFDQMINDENTDPNNIISYINTNIVQAGAADVERFFSGLLGFGTDIREIDFTGLEESRQYMPEDMIAFMDLMKLEADTPSMVMSDEENRRVINMTLSEMLERALLFEQHLEKYPNDVTTEAAANLYEEIATHAITGGYDKTEGIAHYYKGETDDVVDREALQYYQQFAEANPDSNLGKIVKEYVDLLQTNQFQINDEMEDFYMGLHERLAVDKWVNADTNGTDTNNTEVNGANNSSTAGNNGSTTAAGTNASNASNAANTNNTGADTVIQGTVTK